MIPDQGVHGHRHRVDLFAMRGKHGGETERCMNIASMVDRDLAVPVRSTVSQASIGPNGDHTHVPPKLVGCNQPGSLAKW
jgi:hypothetical protein